MINSRVVPSSGVERLTARDRDLARVGAGLDRGLRLLSTLWVGVMAGFFFAFSAVVMPGLDVADPAAAMAAMQGINDIVVNPAFALFFFGAPVLCLGSIVRALIRRDRLAWLELVAAAVYLVGVFGVTVAFNVPLNDDLARLDPTVPTQARTMTIYIDDWTVWNHVRTATGLLAFGLFAVASIIRVPPKDEHGAPAHR